jgi:hypothetical protein
MRRPQRLLPFVPCFVALLLRSPCIGQTKRLENLEGHLRANIASCQMDFYGGLAAQAANAWRSNRLFAQNLGENLSHISNTSFCFAVHDEGIDVVLVAYCALDNR